MRTLIVACLWLATGSVAVAARSQTMADLQMTTTLGSNNTVFVTPLREISASFVVRNLGPDNVTNVSAQSGLAIPISGLVQIIPAPDCDMRNVGSPSLPIIWNIGSLAAGETKYCFVRIRAVTGAPLGTILFGQTVQSVIENTDPNDSNDSASIRVNYRGIDYVADFQFTATKSFSTLPPLSRGIVSVTAKNLGPEAVPLAAARLQGYSIGPNDTDAFFLTPIAQPDPNCFLDLFASVCGPFGDCDVNADLYFGAMAAGESRTCVFAITATRFAQGTRRFKISGAGDGLDINQQNNDASFDLIFTNIQFIPLGGHGWLMALLLVTGVIFLRHRKA
jgi:Domain of unknown function DUF11